MPQQQLPCCSLLLHSVGNMRKLPGKFLSLWMDFLLLFKKTERISDYYRSLSVPIWKHSYRSMLSVVIRDAFPVGLKGIRWPLCVSFLFFAELLYSGLVGSSSRSLGHAAASLENIESVWLISTWNVNVMEERHSPPNVSTNSSWHLSRRQKTTKKK